MKKCVALFCVICLLFTIPLLTAAIAPGKALYLYVGSNTALVGEALEQVDQNPEVVPFVEAGRTLVPVRFIAEQLAGEVTWNAEARTIFIRSGSTELLLTVDEATMLVNGKATELDTPPVIAHDRTFVPLRAVFEALGQTVFYDRGLIVISEKALYDENTSKTTLDGIIKQVNVLPVVGSAENYEAYLQERNSVNLYRGGAGGGSTFGAVKEMAVTSNSMAAMDTAVYTAPVPEGAFSETNVQTQGVDEADVVKTDGAYIYNLAGGRLTITRAWPAEELAVVSSTDVGEDLSPTELYVDGDRLVLICSSWQEFEAYYEDEKGEHVPYMSTKPFTAVKVYDIADRANPVEVRHFESEGRYMTSRKIGSAFYLVTNKTSYEATQAEGYQPVYFSGGAKTCIGFDSIRCFPGSESTNMLVTAGLDLDDDTKEPVVEAYLGAGEDIYVSTENMYITVSRYEYEQIPHEDEYVNEKGETLPYTWYSHKTTGVYSDIYKFSLNQGDITYLAKGTVEGTVLNQFSMDEYEGKLRIATTTRLNETSASTVYVLDDTLQQLGAAGGLGEGERIYSVRFMGDRGYVVTYQETDPLYVLDLTDPAAPAVAGELKIPGYSNYLHPYDETHLIGIGMHSETAENGTTYDLGMKLSMFDVSDMANPQELFVEYLGDRGTSSEINYNHKALLFSHDKGILSFPVTLHKLQGDTWSRGGYPNYGEFETQGAVLYDVDLETGFTLRGLASQIDEEDRALVADYGYVPSTRAVSRGLYIGDVFYTISEKYVYAYDLETLEPLASTELY